MALAMAMAACSSDSDTMAFDESGAPMAPGGASNGTGPGTTTPGQEREVESDYEAPVATGHYVWVANPKSGRVAYVDAATLEVHTVEAGNGPTYVSSVPAQTDDTALVLNVLSQDATLLRATKNGISTKTFDVAARANSVAYSADGRYAIAWADARKVDQAPRTEGFQDLTILDLVAGTSYVVAVGYRPVAVGFAAGTTHAYAVTQDGIAILEASGTPAVTSNVAVSDTPNEDPGSRDVSVTPDGKVALIRRDGSSSVTVVSLDKGTRASVALPGEVTDLDLTDLGDKAIATIRETSQVAILPVPGILTDPATFETVPITGETVGSVVLPPGGLKALLYTNAFAAERLTILDLAQTPPPFRTVRLYSPVLAVFSSPDANHAVVLHDRTQATADGTPGTPGAFSVVPVGNALPAKIVATQAPPAAVAVVDDRAIVAERDNSTKVFGAYLVKMPQLMVDRLPLASPPIAVGVVEGAKRAYVSQQHPEGRLTFVDLDTGAARTLTGFELSARVVDGSKP
ncbi:hypothetical protein AKJ09_09418 [Labilithrix luteola]|uniref:Uncharacterized protein n=2 Tax=Labilithrix luteola TaxID=1391654 RepID=A0A0K1QBH5_9BACT|nr:hypothetical protein AKJ09_09418 [Labilithrix luteola]